jgi:protease-4
MREDERKLAQDMVNDVFNQFVKDVDAGRKNLNLAEVRKLADGRVYTGSQAKKVGLVDDLGNYHDALAIAAKAGGIEGEPQVKTYGRSRGFYGLFSERASSQLPVGTGMPLPRPLGPGIWLLWESEEALSAE